MRLKLYLKNSAKHILKLLIVSFFFAGCTTSTTPTYLKNDISDAMQSICKKEYKIDVRVKLVGKTLWVYVPLEDIFTKSDKPEKSIERFLLKYNESDLKAGVLKIDYLIKTVPEQEKYQQTQFEKSAAEKVSDVWSVLRRVVFSMEQSEENEPRFFCIVIADIKNAIQIKEIVYYHDLKKIFYGFISRGEFQHRTVQDVSMPPEILNDSEGIHINYYDISFEEFISKQIKNRIELKFQKPEVEKDVDIDKEVRKIAKYTLKIYGFEDFSSVELYNLLTNNRIILNRSAALSDSSD